MKRLIRTIYAQSKKLDKDLFDFLQTCVDTFTYNTNAALLNECMSYMSNINIKDISEDNESEMYMYYMKIKSYAINNDLMDEFENLKNQDAVDKELVSEGYTTDIVINEGTKVSGDQMVCTYKNDRLGDTYYIFEVNDKFILKSSSDLNTDLLVTNNDDAGFNEIENLIIEHINNMPGYVRNTMGLTGIDVATEAWQEYLNNTTGANRDNSEQTSQTNNTKSNNSDNSQNTKIDDTTEYTVDIKFDSKDIAIINSFVNSANNSRYVVNTNFEQIKDASLKHRLVKRAFMADNIISSFKSYFPDMEFISAYFGNKGVVHPSSGMLDIDVRHPGNSVANENIVYTKLQKMEEGVYTIKVINASMEISSTRPNVMGLEGAAFFTRSKISTSPFIAGLIFLSTNNTLLTVISSTAAWRRPRESMYPSSCKRAFASSTCFCVLIVLGRL